MRNMTHSNPLPKDAIGGNIQSDVYLMDCMEGMARYEDNYFDLAVVDPPYGLGKRVAHAGDGRNSLSIFAADHKTKNWDNEIPSNKYFTELMRVSKNQIIWGGNYFPLPPTRCFICWDKMVFIPSMSRIEQAWTSFDRLPKLIQVNNNDSNRIHVTQKPVTLYDWIFDKYAQPGDKILDTHLGSQSSRIAAHKAKLPFVGYELDEDYFRDGNKRFENYIRQGSLF